MTETVNVREMERRSQKYWNVDGLPEVTMGLLWIVWGASFLVGQSLPSGPVWNTYWSFTPVLLALSGAAAVWATKKLKARFTFPRAGYIEWRPPTRAQRLTAAGVAMASAAMLVALIARGRAEGLERVAAPGMGVLLTVAFVMASITQRAPHMLALAGVALTLGLALRASTTGWEAMNWMLVGIGAATLLVGTIRFCLFVRTHPLEQRT